MSGSSGERSAASPGRVLIIKPSAIGDVVHALPILPRLRKLWPAAKLSWMVTPGCAALVERHPLVDEVILFERKRLGRGWHSPAALWELGAFLWALRRRGFDLVIDLQGLFRSAGVSMVSGAPRRIGFSNARELRRCVTASWWIARGSMNTRWCDI